MPARPLHCCEVLSQRLCSAGVQQGEVPGQAAQRHWTDCSKVSSTLLFPLVCSDTAHSGRKGTQCELSAYSWFVLFTGSSSGCCPSPVPPFPRQWAVAAAMVNHPPYFSHLSSLVKRCGLAGALPSAGSQLLQQSVWKVGFLVWIEQRQQSWLQCVSVIWL